MKEILTTLTPTMQLADTSMVSRAICDKNFNILLPRSDILDQILEEILPSKDIPALQKYLGRRKKEEKFLKKIGGWWLNSSGA